LVSIGLVISLAQGIIHPYYAVALAPPLGGLVGIATFGLWQRRDSWVARGALAAALGVTVVWTYVLLGRSADWFPALRPLVAVAGLLGVAGILALPLLHRAPRVAVALVAACGFGAALAVPLFSTVATAATPHNGAIPSVTPTPAAGFGGPGGGFPGGGPGGFRRAFGGAGGFPGALGGGGFPGGLPGGATNGTGGAGGGFPGAFGNGGAPIFGGGQRRFGGGGFAAGGPGGGFLNSSASDPALSRALQANAGRYTWAAATVNSNSAAGYQLSSGEPVMAIGGFNGTDPTPTLAQFEKDVAQGKIHYFIAGGSVRGVGGSGSDASQITAWVESHFTAETIGGVSVYDLSS
jgi:hypothetical protein